MNVTYTVGPIRTIFNAPIRREVLANAALNWLNSDPSNKQADLALQTELQDQGLLNMDEVAQEFTADEDGAWVVRIDTASRVLWLNSDGDAWDVMKAQQST